MRKFLFLITLFSTCIGLATAQSPVKGSVKDNTGEPIIGASVVEKGTTNGVATDISGEFTITVKAGATLQISYLGYVKQEVPVPARSTLIEVTLLEDYTTLDEVVVVGYGTQKKATLVGAVSSVSNKDISVTKNENVVNMLTGKLPGVRISQLSSRPGEFATKIDIRGMGTPLVVVDGITRDIGYFSRMDANEIESISVLKDASAAIYGLRSANGVLLVTTKRGDQEGKFDVTYSTNYGWQQFLYLPDNVDALDYMTLRNEKKWRDFGSNYMNRQLPDYNDADRAPFLNGTQQTTDWMSALFHDVTPQYQHNVSIDGSTDKVNYFFNLGYLNQSGALKTDAMNYNRWNFRSNIDVKLTNRLKAEISFGGYMDEMNEPAMDIWTVYKSAWLQRPYVPIYANGNPEYLNSYEVQDDNPLALTDPNIAGYRNNVARVFNSSLALSYKIPFIEGLTARAMYSYNYNYQENSNFSKFFYLYRYYPDTDYYEPSARHGSSGDN
ncbi:MAG: SusC/RagA family TonB-linked outer membrane protein, partial [Tannerella sp.]|nr:SusC/RagA family TonB-linked outer membrane protein [Tannerella sp.]